MEELNLNSIVKVQLNKSGRQVVEDRLNSCLDLEPAAFNNVKDYLLSKIDEDDFFTARFWEIIKIFGSYLDPGNSNFPFSSGTVLVHEKDLDKHKRNKIKNKKI